MPPESSSKPSKKSLFNLNPDQRKRIAVRHYYLKKAEREIPRRMSVLEKEGFSPKDAQRQATQEFNASLKEPHTTEKED